MKVGTIVKLKVVCLGNEAGTLGVVFNNYGDGCQAIFENGNYDGFSTQIQMGGSGRNPMMDSEAIAFLEKVGVEPTLSSYQFTNVIRLAEHFRRGVFNLAWSEKWKGVQC